MAYASEGGAVPHCDNIFSILLVFKMEISSNPAETQRLIEGLILVSAGAQVRELRATLLNPGFSPR